LSEWAVGVVKVGTSKPVLELCWNTLTGLGDDDVDSMTNGNTVADPMSVFTEPGH